VHWRRVRHRFSTPGPAPEQPPESTKRNVCRWRGPPGSCQQNRTGQRWGAFYPDTTRGAARVPESDNGVESESATEAGRPAPTTQNRQVVDEQRERPPIGG